MIQKLPLCKFFANAHRLWDHFTWNPQTALISRHSSAWDRNRQVHNSLIMQLRITHRALYVLWYCWCAHASPRWWWCVCSLECVFSPKKLHLFRSRRTSFCCWEQRAKEHLISFLGRFVPAGCASCTHKHNNTCNSPANHFLRQKMQFDKNDRRVFVTKEMLKWRFSLLFTSGSHSQKVHLWEEAAWRVFIQLLLHH